MSHIIFDSKGIKKIQEADLLFRVRVIYNYTVFFNIDIVTVIDVIVQRILYRYTLIQNVIGIGRYVIQRVLDREQIAVSVVGVGSYVVLSIGCS